VKTSPWAKLLPALGLLLLGVLLAATTVVWLDRGPAGDDRLGPLMAMTQAGRSDMRRAWTGDAEALASLPDTQAAIGRLRAAPAADDTAARRVLAEAELWTGIDRNLGILAGSAQPLSAFRQARSEILELAPQLLLATSSLMSALSPSDLAANRSFLDRFELTIQGLELNVRGLATPGSDLAAGIAALSDAQQFLEQIVRGLSGEDSGLGLSSVSGQAAAESLGATTALFGRMRAAIDAITSVADSAATAAYAVEEFDLLAGQLQQVFAAASESGIAPRDGDSRLAFYLVGGALSIMILMMLAYYAARDYRRAAELQAEQNERNQQAILRLLDELSSLADGDLTVEATVTEDITGAIADSINYAIDALRELVATVNDSSILVDAAAKQTESTSKHLVRASETQAMQAAAATDSVAKMAASIEEISGNAERCSDVARYSVDIAHKGGEAVRRTIEGMNTIRETIQDTSKRIKRLGESSQEIGNIVELIEEIAEQTNILALNASIEASRAGESSRGFAVVADEVQKLAERSTNATRKIEVLVSTIQSDTNEAVVSMERSTTDVVGGALLAENAGAALEEIEQVSHQIASLVQNISGTARDQSRVSGAINKNMQVLRHISAKSTESSAATSGAISKLSELASQLRRTVKGFTLPDNVTATGILTQAQVSESLNREQELEKDIEIQSLKALKSG
jgi:twitching motility protein PilJ